MPTNNLQLVTKFAMHTLAAVGLFALIGGAAALLNAYSRLLANAGMPPLIIQSIHVTEYVLFTTDLVCFLIYTFSEAYKLARYILSGAPS